MTSSVEQFRYLGICLGSVVCVVGTIGNTMTILAYATNPRMRTAFNMLIVSLAVIDLGLSAFILPFIIYGYSNNEWPFSTKSCEVFAYFYYALHYTSSVNLFTISFNRYMHVSRPRAAYRIIFSKRKRRIAALLMWSFAPICLLPLIFTGGFGWWENGLMCAFTRNPGFADTYSLVMRVLFQFVPLFGMVILYALIFHTVKQSHANIDNRKATEASDSGFQSNETSRSGGLSSPSRRIGYDRTPGYQLRLSFTPTSPTGTTKTSLETPADNRRVWRQNPTILAPITSTSEKVIEPEYTKSGTKSDDDIQLYSSVLRRMSVTMKHARLCRSVTANNLGALPVVGNLSESGKPNDTTSTHQNFQRTQNQSNNHRIGAEICPNTNISSVRPQSLVIRNIATPHGGGKNLKRSLSFTPPSLKRTLSTSISKIASTPNRMKERISSMRTARSKESTIVRRTSIQHARAQRQLLYMSTVICATFAFCALPSLILNLVGHYNFISTELFMAASNLGWLNSMINPIVYAAMNVQFRKEYSRVMQKITNLVWPRRTKVYPIKSSLKKDICTA